MVEWGPGGSATVEWRCETNEKAGRGNAILMFAEQPKQTVGPVRGALPAPCAAAPPPAKECDAAQEFSPGLTAAARRGRTARRMADLLGTLLGLVGTSCKSKDYSPQKKILRCKYESATQRNGSGIHFSGPIILM